MPSEQPGTRRKVGPNSENMTELEKIKSENRNIAFKK